MWYMYRNEDSVYGNEDSYVIVIDSSISILQIFSEWKQKLGPQLNKNVVLLTGETSTDLRLLREVPHPHTPPTIIKINLYSRVVLLLVYLNIGMCSVEDGNKGNMFKMSVCLSLTSYT